MCETYCFQFCVDAWETWDLAGTSSKSTNPWSPQQIRHRRIVILSECRDVTDTPKPTNCVAGHLKYQFVGFNSYTWNPLYFRWHWHFRESLYLFIIRNVKRIFMDVGQCQWAFDLAKSNTDIQKESRLIELWYFNHKCIELYSYRPVQLIKKYIF